MIFRRQFTYGLLGGLIFIGGASIFAPSAVDACTRIFWNTNPGLMIVARNEDFVTASHPTFVATTRGVKRWGTADESKRSKSMSWTVKYGNVAV